MKEIRQGDYLASLSWYLRRFFCSENEALETVRQYLKENPGANKATIFTDLSTHKGMGEISPFGF